MTVRWNADRRSEQIHVGSAAIIRSVPALAKAASTQGLRIPERPLALHFGTLNNEN